MSMHTTKMPINLSFINLYTGGVENDNVAIGTKASAEQSCPESGIWKVVGSPTTTAPIARGNTTPPYNNKGVVWSLVRYA